MIRMNQLCSSTTISAKMKTFLLAIILLSLAIFHSSAQNTRSLRGATITPAALPTDIKEYLDVHNKARAEVGVKPLVWNYTLAKSASLDVGYQRDAHGCEFADLTYSKYGGNQIWSSGITLTPRQAVESWVEEKKYYIYASNSCLESHPCETYTQVVWRKSVELGCAQAKCVEENSALTICFYNPPGNVVGESPY